VTIFSEKVKQGKIQNIFIDSFLQEYLILYFEDILKIKSRPFGIYQFSGVTEW